jgi:hypothetical protein
MNHGHGIVVGAVHPVEPGKKRGILHAKSNGKELLLLPILQATS